MAKKTAITKEIQEVRARLSYARISPRKMRLVADALRGLSAEHAKARIAFIEKKGADFLSKLLASAVANAKQKNIEMEKLVVKTLFVDGGPVLKRFTPKAHGRATPIRRRTSHVTLVLTEKN